MAQEACNRLSAWPGHRACVTCLVHACGCKAKPWITLSPVQVLVYFAVAKKGEKPTDGKTDVNPEGLTAGEGCWLCW